MALKGVFKIKFFLPLQNISPVYSTNLSLCASAYFPL